MKKSLVFMVVVTVAVVLLFQKKDYTAIAQVTSGPVPTPTPFVDYLSAEDKILIKKVKEVSDRFEAEMAVKEPKWKLKKKFVGHLSFGILPPEKGGGQLKTASSSFHFKKGNTLGYVYFHIVEPSTAEERAASFRFGLERRARGIAKGVADMGDEAVVTMDDPGLPSNGAGLYFRKGIFSAHIDATNQSKTRELNEENAKRIGRLLDSAIL